MTPTKRSKIIDSEEEEEDEDMFEDVEEDFEDEPPPPALPPAAKPAAVVPLPPAPVAPAPAAHSTPIEIDDEEEEEEEEEDEEDDEPPPPPLPTKQTPPKAASAEPQTVPTPSSSSSSSTVAPPPFLANLKQIKLPTGNAVALVGKFLIELNRPVNMPLIVQKFKELLTKNQVEKAVFQLTQANVVLTLEDSKQPLFWTNQQLVEDTNKNGDFDLKAVNAWFEQNQQDAGKREQAKHALEAEVKALIMAPTDDQLDGKLAEEMAVIAKLKPRVEECELILKEAEKLGRSAADMQAGLISESKRELVFYRGEWRKRKAHLMEFVERVCESKGGGLRGQAKKELLEKMGIDLDEDVGAKLLRGTDL